MSDVQEKKRQAMIRLLATARANTFTQEGEADYVLNHGGDVTLPPEPQWKPGQYGTATTDLMTVTGFWAIDEDDGSLRFWFVTSDGHIDYVRDHYVKSFEPVVVLTAEEIRARRFVTPWEEVADE